MPLTITQEAIIQLVKKLLIFALIELENLLISALVFKDFLFSIQLVVELVLDSDLFF